MTRLVRALLACAVSACVDARDPVASTHEDDLLANAGIHELEHDGAAYVSVGRYWSEQGGDLAVRREALSLAWPLRGESRALMQRFAEPTTVLHFGFFHTGLDVIRRDATESDDVLAPVSGLAKVFDCRNGACSARQGVAPPATFPRAPHYETLVGIHDPTSGAVVMLLHVEPTAALAASSAPLAVREGESIGRLARVPIDTEAEPTFRHTHVDVLDGATATLLDPELLLRDYRDRVKPTLAGVYLLDDAGKVAPALTSGRFDVVVEAFDRDDDSNRNLAPTALAVEISDDQGRTLRTLGRCTLAHLIDSVAQVPRASLALDVVDFERSRHELDASWPDTSLGNRSRQFRYAVTGLTEKGGRCAAVADEAGFIDVGADVSRIDVHVTAWDAAGGTTEQRATFSRP